MDRALAWVIAASVAGLAFMAAVSAFTQPPHVDLAEVAGHVGRTVTTSARILELESHDTGWTRLVLGDGNHSLDATATAPPRAVPGDLVEATGVVLRAGTRLRLQIDHPDDVTVKVPWQDQHQPLRRLLHEPWALRDANVVTSGEYRRVASTQVLEDGPHRLRILGAALADWEPGTVLRVEGGLEYDEESGTYRLRVDHARLA